MSQLSLSELKSNLEAFHASLEVSNFANDLPDFHSIGKSEFETFLHGLDEDWKLSPNLTTKLLHTKSIIDSTYSIGCEKSDLNKIILCGLYGCIHCTIWASATRGEMPAFVELLEQTGRSIRSSLIVEIRESQKQVSRQLWGCVCRINEEIIRLCKVYISQGIDNRNSKQL